MGRRARISDPGNSQMSTRPLLFSHALDPRSQPAPPENAPPSIQQPIPPLRHLPKARLRLHLLRQICASRPVNTPLAKPTRANAEFSALRAAVTIRQEKALREPKFDCAALHLR